MTVELGFSTLGCPEMSVDQIISAARRWECTHLELRFIRGTATDDLTVGEMLDVSSALASSDLAVSALATALRLEDNPTDRALDRLAGFAADCGAVSLRVFGGDLVDDRDSKTALHALERAVSWCSKRGVILAVENHLGWSSAAGLRSALDQVSLPVGVIWDPEHSLGVGETPAEAWDAIGDRCIEMQVKDIDATGHPAVPGSGVLPLADCLRLAHERTLVVEWEKYWHPEIDSGDVAIPEALDFVRRTLEVDAER